ncbi:hypothetical protein EC846_1530 [Acinetobacter sp. BIGb0102]|nr:hypothetical protein EC846_1530 [Acinetobacter sp. BIGb0102]
MRIKLIAYDPESKRRFRLKEYIQQCEGYSSRVFYEDGTGNLVYNFYWKQLFESNQYVIGLKVLIDGNEYYLIGEY